MVTESIRSVVRIEGWWNSQSCTSQDGVGHLRQSFKLLQWLHKYSLIPIPYPAMASQVQPHSNPLPSNGFTSTASFQSFTL